MNLIHSKSSYLTIYALSVRVGRQRRTWLKCIVADGMMSPNNEEDITVPHSPPNSVLCRCCNCHYTNPPAPTPIISPVWTVPHLCIHPELFSCFPRAPANFSGCCTFADAGVPGSSRISPGVEIRYYILLRVEYYGAARLGVYYDSYTRTKYGLEQDAVVRFVLTGSGRAEEKREQNKPEKGSRAWMKWQVLVSRYKKLSFLLTCSGQCWWSLGHLRFRTRKESGAKKLKLGLGLSVIQLSVFKWTVSIENPDTQQSPHAALGVPSVAVGLLGYQLDKKKLYCKFPGTNHSLEIPSTMIIVCVPQVVAPAEPIRQNPNPSQECLFLMYKKKNIVFKSWLSYSCSPPGLQILLGTLCFSWFQICGHSFSVSPADIPFPLSPSSWSLGSNGYCTIRVLVPLVYIRSPVVCQRFQERGRFK